MPFKDVKKRRQWQRNRRARRKYFMKDKVCKDCGTNKNLDLHHRDKTTKIASWIWLWSDKKIKEETDKCDVLCHSCHTKFHNKEKIKPIQHGTTYAYNFHKCRCDLCKRITSERMKKYQ